MDGLNLFVKRIGLIGISRFLIFGIGLIFIPLFTKITGATGYGAWAQIVTLIALIQPFIQLGLGNSILRFFTNKPNAEFSKSLCAILVPIILVGLLVIVIINIFSTTIASNLLQDPSSSYLIRLVGPLILVGALIDVISNVFRVKGEIRFIAIANILQTLLEMGFISTCLLNGFGIYGALVSILLVRSLTVSVMLIFIFWDIGIQFPDFSPMSEYLTYGVPLIFIGFFEILLQSSDKFIIGYYLGASAVGIYNAAYSIATTPVLFISIVMFILYPTMYGLFESQEMDNLLSVLHYSWKYLLLILIPASFGLTVLSGPILTLLTTPEFLQSGVYLIPVVSLTNILMALYAIYGGILTLRKQTHVILINCCVAAIINIMLNVLLVPRFGLISAAFTTIIAYIILVYLCYRNSRFIKFTTSKSIIVKSVIASIIMVLPIILIAPNDILSISFSILIGFLVYIILLVGFKAFSEDEINFLKR